MFTNITKNMNLTFKSQYIFHQYFIIQNYIIINQIYKIYIYKNLKKLNPKVSEPQHYTYQMHKQLNQQPQNNQIHQVFKTLEHDNGTLNTIEQFISQQQKNNISSTKNKEYTQQIDNKQKIILQRQQFFIDKDEQRNKNMISGQPGLFKRTYSFYQQQQQIQQHKHIGQSNLKKTNHHQQQHQLQNQQNINKQNITIQHKQQNKYTKYKKFARQFLKYLYIGHFISLLRFVMIGFAYYFLSFTIPVKQRTGQTSGNMIGNNKIYQPWNVMIYFLSGSIDFISVIGYITSMKTVSADIKTLQIKQNLQNIRIQKQRQRQNLQKLRRSRKTQNLQHQIISQQQIPHPPQPQQQQQINPTYTYRIGKQSVYNSFYSALRQYKYINRDQSAPFKISKVMHITATFLFFGRIALTKQYNYNYDNVGREMVLWLFLLTAYLGPFQVDLFGMDASVGPFIKIDKFHTSTIRKVYHQFYNWRNKYGLIMKIGTVYTVIIILIDFVRYLVQVNYPLSAAFYVKLPLLLISYLTITQNTQKITRSKQYLQKLPIVPHMAIHKNLSLLGISHEYTSKYDKIISSLFRVILILCGLAILRESDQIADGIIQFISNTIVFVIFFLGESFKFKTFMKSKINLLNSCLFKQVCNPTQLPNFFPLQQNSGTQQHFEQSLVSNNKQFKNPNQSINHQSKPAIKQNRNLYKYIQQHSKNFILPNLQIQPSCSVCLLQYQQQQKVIVVCCGHIFHEQCLIDWLKHKKQCPLCRLNIEEFYDDVSI